MTKHLHNLKAILAAVILMALTAPAANALSRSYSIDDLTGSTWAPSESMYNALVYTTDQWIFYRDIFYRDLLVEVNGAELKLEKQDANTIIVKNAFGGLMDLPFTYNGSTFTLKTNATADGQPLRHRKNNCVANIPVQKWIQLGLSPIHKIQPRISRQRMGIGCFRGKSRHSRR